MEKIQDDLLCEHLQHLLANIPRARNPYPHLATSEPPAAAHGHATIMLLDTNKPHHLACSGVPNPNIKNNIYNFPDHKNSFSLKYRYRKNRLIDISISKIK